ncbi:hypothetical protein [Stutzerimonas stutzeri]|uniref:hypothetical protein n=1 Tax=Stutzerimonas stutzeri TaxID=316 RepID=UPI0015E34555|nr:hypothetical protein [Stutzerimonas stutzeri]MBA1276698.1 hypothetical protein [Stutzerimonas stutzeri]
MPAKRDAVSREFASPDRLPLALMPFETTATRLCHVRHRAAASFVAWLTPALPIAYDRRPVAGRTAGPSPFE